MCKIVSPRVGVAIAAALGLSACVTLPPNHVKNPQDPWESWNRGVYGVNNKLDRAVALPVAKAYVRHVPGGIRKSVSNFFANVTTPGVMVNDALEGKFKNAASDLGRFLLNTVVGFGGLFDPASSAGLDRNYADFGLTLGHWGVHQGPFFELPILGPSTVRDGLGKVPDYYLRPTTYIPSDWIVGYVLWLPAAVDARADRDRGRRRTEPRCRSSDDARRLPGPVQTAVVPEAECLERLREAVKAEKARDLDHADVRRLRQDLLCRERLGGMELGVLERVPADA